MIDCQSESGEAVKVSDKLTQQPRLCPNFSLTHDTDLLFPHHCEQQNAAHSEAFFQPLKHMNVWQKIWFWDMQMSDFRFVFNPLEGKWNRGPDWYLERRLKSAKSWECEAILKSLQTGRRSAGRKNECDTFLFLTLWTFWQRHLFVFVTKGVLYLIIDMSRHPKENSYEQGIWVVRKDQKTALITSGWVKCKYSRYFEKYVSLPSC